MNTIIGAGMAGLLAGHAWPMATIAESAPEPREVHKALLRFRSDAVSKLTGIEFRRVRVHKGIWSVRSESFVPPDIRLANLYAQKVLGYDHIKGDRSIWNIEPVDRFIAPEDFYEQLLNNVGRRIQWGASGGFSNRLGTIISTAPMPVALQAAKITTDQSFRKSGITVRRWRLRNTDLFQTIYFPDSWTALYRASITKDMLIAEFADGHEDDEEGEWVHDMSEAFGIRFDEVAEPMGKVEQKYGKIEPIDDAARKQLLFQLTHDHGIFSLGRFATWRNILLDDIVDDIAVIKRLLRAGASSYDLKMAVK
jgi:hypothetical protein